MRVQESLAVSLLATAAAAAPSGTGKACKAKHTAAAQYNDKHVAELKAQVSSLRAQISSVYAQPSQACQASNYGTQYGSFPASRKLGLAGWKMGCSDIARCRDVGML